MSVNTKFVYWSIIHQRVLGKFTSYQQTEFTLSKLTANGNLCNLLSAKLGPRMSCFMLYKVRQLPKSAITTFFTLLHMFLGNTHSITVNSKLYCTCYTSGQHPWPCFHLKCFFSPIFEIMAVTMVTLKYKNVWCPPEHFAIGNVHSDNLPLGIIALISFKQEGLIVFSDNILHFLMIKNKFVEFTKTILWL